MAILDRYFERGNGVIIGLKKRRANRTVYLTIGLGTSPMGRPPVIALLGSEGHRLRSLIRSKGGQTVRPQLALGQRSQLVIRPTARRESLDRKPRRGVNGQLHFECQATLMADAALATVCKDWLTSLGIVVGGSWALWRFAYQDWLRRRSEFPSLEGGTLPAEILECEGDRAVVCLKWTWRNVGTRPLYVDPNATEVAVFDITDRRLAYIDPRQQYETGELGEPSRHKPLLNYGVFFLEPGTTSHVQTIPVLQMHRSYIARMQICADRTSHPTGQEWPFGWERWLVFRTEPNVATVRKVDAAA